MKFGFRAGTASIIGAAAFAALVAAAPSALADPAAPPIPDPAPMPMTAPMPMPMTAPAPLPAPAAVPLAPAADPAVTPLAAGPVAEGVPHLLSPDNPPPGTAITPTSQSRLGYLRDLWHAMQTQEVSGSNALLLLTQRPMSASPAGGEPTGPPAPAPAPLAPPVVP